MNIDSFCSDIGHKFQGSGRTPLQKLWGVPLPLHWGIDCTRLQVDQFICLSFRCDCLLATPSMFIDILAHPDLKKYDLSSLRKGNGVYTN